MHILTPKSKLTFDVGYAQSQNVGFHLHEITMRIHHHEKNQDLCETSPFSQLVNIVGTPIKDGK